MASKTAIMEAWSLFVGATLAPPSGWEPTDEALDAWVFALGEVSDADLGAASRRHLATSRFWPAPSQLVALALELEVKVEPRPEPATGPWYDLWHTDPDLAVGILDDTLLAFEPCGACIGGAPCPVCFESHVLPKLHAGATELGEAPCSSS